VSGRISGKVTPRKHRHVASLPYSWSSFRTLLKYGAAGARSSLSPQPSI
jgi:hypothetical protein